MQGSFEFITDVSITREALLDTSDIPTQVCTGRWSCGRILPITDFYETSAGSRSKYEITCKDCWAKKNATDKATRTLPQREYVAAHLKDHHCVCCPESNPVVLEFDHIIPADKEHSISDLCGSSRHSLQVLIDEIAKCRVLCANCHRKVTALDRSYWILGYYPISPDDPIRKVLAHTDQIKSTLTIPANGV